LTSIVNIYLRARVRVCACMHACMHARMHARMYVCMYVL